MIKKFDLKVKTIDPEETEKVNKMYKFGNLGMDYFYSETYNKAISYLNQSLVLRNAYIPSFEENFTQLYPYLTTSESISANMATRNQELLYLGIAYRKMNDYYQARRIFENLINFALTLGKDIYPYFNEHTVFFPFSKKGFLSRVWMELSKLNLDLGLYHNALNILNNIIEMDYDLINVWMDLAIVYQNLGNVKESKRAIRRFKKKKKIIRKIQKKMEPQW